MDSFLVKMSRRRSLMVPVVTLLAISLGIGGYYIQDRQIAAKKEAEQQQEDNKQKQPQAVTNAGLETIETVEESTKTTEDGTPAEVVAVELTVTDAPENSEVILSAKIGSKKGGNCVFTLKDGNYGPEETVKTKGSTCEARLQNPGNGVWVGKVLYTSEDGQTRGDAVQEITL